MDDNRARISVLVAMERTGTGPKKHKKGKKAAEDASHLAQLLAAV
jgi:hypothetical protein